MALCLPTTRPASSVALRHPLYRYYSDLPGLMVAENGKKLFPIRSAHLADGKLIFSITVAHPVIWTFDKYEHDPLIFSVLPGTGSINISPALRQAKDTYWRSAQPEMKAGLVVVLPADLMGYVMRSF